MASVCLHASINIKHDEHCSRVASESDAMEGGRLLFTLRLSVVCLLSCACSYDFAPKLGDAIHTVTESAPFSAGYNSLDQLVLELVRYEQNQTSHLLPLRGVTVRPPPPSPDRESKVRCHDNQSVRVCTGCTPRLKERESLKGTWFCSSGPCWARLAAQKGDGSRLMDTVVVCVCLPVCPFG